MTGEFKSIERKFDKEMTGMHNKIAEHKEQLEIHDVEKQRLCNHLNALKEAAKVDAGQFEDKLREIVVQSEKGKLEAEQKNRNPLLKDLKGLNRSGLSQASETRNDAVPAAKYTGKHLVG